MSEKLLQRLKSDGPKRILALDGGGIRGALTTRFVKKIETLLRQRHNNPELLLCDYFDLIGGTSTGAIIAALLATGHSADDITKLYAEFGKRIFGKKNSILEFWNAWKAGYESEPLEKKLKEIFGDMTLGSPELRTGLCVVAKRADTFSTWPMINHPEGKYYNPAKEGQIGNKDFLLREVVRASTAAPTYFVPQAIQMGDREAVFVDGGVSMANSPALQCFLLATLHGFPFHWKTGEKNLMIVSLGTGTFTKTKNPELVRSSNLIDWASSLPEMFMTDAGDWNQLILQYLSKSPTAAVLDSEIGDLRDDLLTPKPALHYIRYQAHLEQPKQFDDGSFEKKPHLPFDAKTLEKMREMDDASQLENQFAVGDIYAEYLIREEHFPKAFDLPKMLV